MDRYGLKNLSIEDLATIKRVASDINGNGLIKSWMALSFANASEQGNSRLFKCFNWAKLVNN